MEESKEIVAMISAEPETQPEFVQFSASVFSEGNVEDWLTRIQNMMVNTLYDITKKSYYSYPVNPLERGGDVKSDIAKISECWLFSYPAQPVLTVDQIRWTEGCTKALVDISDGKKTAMIEYNEFNRELINRMVALVRVNLSILQRTLMGALIVIDVHARDVVTQMVNASVSSINDFEWSKQLRYYWDKDITDGPKVEDCVVRQTNTRFIYGYEYLGNGPRLVITPLTDKCYMTLTGAKHLNYGGAPAGPAGTGKTETTKDLAKALAV